MMPCLKETFFILILVCDLFLWFVLWAGKCLKPRESGHYILFLIIWQVTWFSLFKCGPHTVVGTLWRLVCCRVTVGVSHWEESGRENKVSTAPDHPAAGSRARVEHHTESGAYSQQRVFHTAGSGVCCKKSCQRLRSLKAFLSWNCSSHRCI